MQHLFEYLLTLGFGFLARLLPDNLAMGLADRLGDFGFGIIRIRRQVTLDNLLSAFPGKSRAEIRCIAHRTYRNFSRTFFEFLRLPRLTPGKVKRGFEFEGLGILDSLLQKGKGIVVVGGHLGNWELTGAALAQLGYPIWALVNEQRNRLFDRFINATRQRAGVRIIRVGVAARGVLRVLKNNGVVAILSDQDAGRDGLFLNFLGRPASTPKGATTFHLKSGCGLVFMNPYRMGNGRHRVIFSEVTYDPLTDDKEENVRKITRAFTIMLENAVRQHPDQWFWMHRRWKTCPLKSSKFEV
ncbi:lysophospholipid acyltransferase family protein [candidate division KSB1 bacterium]|nr:lysophospholipid acyltransferase family protein [candidate division KSB1 bacterium]